MVDYRANTSSGRDCPAYDAMITQLHPFTKNDCSIIETVVIKKIIPSVVKRSTKCVIRSLDRLRETQQFFTMVFIITILPIYYKVV